MDDYDETMGEGYENEDDDSAHAIAAFKQYRTHTLQRINRRAQLILTLPPAHQRRLSGYAAYLARFRACVEVNEALLELITKDAKNLFHNQSKPARPHPRPRYHLGNGQAHGDHHPSVAVDKVETTLRSLVRDWSAEGAPEREQCYTPILNVIKREFPPERCKAGTVRVLVPGAGLGRLVWEIASLGYKCQGNEFSMFMLIASNFVINFCSEKEKHVFYPWLTSFTNNLTCEHQLLPVRIPDTPPAQHQSHLSMVAGDFTEVYKATDHWDCVATCFFIDCAPNVIDFVEKIFSILKPGGIWINLGPLLYHYSDAPDVESVEPPYDVLMHIIRDVGFIVETERTGVKTKYAQNHNSMVQQEYDSVFFVCRKPLADRATAVYESLNGHGSSAI